MTHYENRIIPNSVSVAVLEELRKRRWPVITNYELFRILWDVYENPDRYVGKIRKRATVPRRRQFERLIFELSNSDERSIRGDPDFNPDHTPSPDTHVFRVTEIPEAQAEDIFCLIEPFSAVAYLSAMQRYGLTTRQPKSLAFVTFEERSWRVQKNKKMENDFGFNFAEAELNFFVNLSFPAIPSTVRGRTLEVHRTKQMPRTQAIADSFARIVEIGDLFVQMLIAPELCGGMRHVIETWEEHAETYLDPIIQAVDAFGSPMVHVRAGYILSEKMGISHSHIESWIKYAQRGGSRKLDPSKPYAPTFSEAWMISLNV